MRTSALIAAAGVLTLALAGCGDEGKAQDAGTNKSGLKPAAQGAPAGGWPQPENGRLTDKMCGLLTAADYAKYGHELMPMLDNPGGGNTQANTVGCMHLLGDSMTLSLHETAKSAQLVFRQELDDHKKQMSGVSQLATGVVPGADESWFDKSTPGGTEYKVAARRGGLIVELVLSGNPQKPDKDPRGALSGLAALVFQRLPNVGTSQTAAPHLVRYQLTGTGKARQVIYQNPETEEQITLHDVKLPWRSQAFPVPDPGTTARAIIVSGLYRYEMASVSIGCNIVVDERVVANETRTGAVTCSHTYGR